MPIKDDLPAEALERTARLLSPAAQRVPGEQARPLPLGDIAAHATRQRIALDEG
jgi:hypothetical protein